jgi:DNA-directed RNA polymerase specialized sigma subunit
MDINNHELTFYKKFHNFYFINFKYGIAIFVLSDIAKVKSYKKSEDREDCIASGLEDLIKYWDRYNPEKSDNAFAFITQVAYNGIKKGWKKIYSAKSIKTISFSSITQEDDYNYNI